MARVDERQSQVDAVVISRHWKGITKPELADRYVEHLKSDTFPKLSALPGFIRATVLRREVESGSEFQVVTEWDSLDSIRGFAGSNVETAVVPDVARAMMVEYDATAVHYSVVTRVSARKSM